MISAIMKITTYVKKNYDALPKSTFNETEVVIVHEFNNEDQGYGHHFYSGIGVDRAGNVFDCQSSGCSCRSDTSATETGMTDFIDQGVDLLTLDWKEVEFARWQVNFQSYE